MTARELLGEWKNAIREITAIQHQIDKVRYSGPCGYKGVIITDMPHGTNDPTSAATQALEHYEDILNQVKQEKAALLEETERMLKTINDSLARVILRRYYGEGLTDDQISNDWDMARETITRRRNKAENYLQNTFIVSPEITASHKPSVL